MNVDVLVAFVRDPHAILDVADRIADSLDSIPDVRWNVNLLIVGSEADFDKAAEAASQRSDIGATLYPDETTMWREAIGSVRPEADVIVTLDGSRDLPEDLPALLRALEPPSVGAAVVARPALSSQGANAAAILAETVTGGASRDLTATYRAWRAPLVKQLPSTEADIVIPAISADVVAQGFRVAEVPASVAEPAPPVPGDFVWRLFRTGLTTRFALAAVLLVLVGCAVFLLSSFPAHQYVADADSVIAGLCAGDVLEGKQWLFFPSGYRLGPHSCYLGAAIVSVMGKTREALGAVTLVYVAVCLTFSYLAMKVALGRIPALFGLLALAFPPMQYILFIEPPWGYGEIVACTAITWWLGFVLLFRPGLRHRWMAFVYGLSLGLTFWTSPQSLMLTAPLTLVMLARRVFATWIHLLLMVLGFVVGLWAYIYTILTKGTGPFTTSFATKPVDSLTQLLSNVHYLLTNVMPIFFLNSGLPPQNPVQGFLLLILLTAVVCTMGVAWKWLAAKNTSASDPRTGIIAVFTILVIVVSCGLFVISGAGSVRGWTVRYLAPLIFALPLMASNLYAVGRQKSVGTVLVVLVLGFSIANATTYRYPGQHDREEQGVALARMHRMVDELRDKRHRNVVLGDYWEVYGLNFGFGAGMDGIPIPTFIDYTFLLRQRVAAGTPVRLALIHAHEPSLVAWASRAGLHGHVEPLEGRFMFLVDGEIAPSQIEAIAAKF